MKKTKFIIVGSILIVLALIYAVLYYIFVDTAIELIILPFFFGIIFFFIRPLFFSLPDGAKEKKTGYSFGVDKFSDKYTQYERIGSPTHKSALKDAEQFRVLFPKFDKAFYKVHNKILSIFGYVLTALFFIYAAIVFYNTIVTDISIILKIFGACVIGVIAIFLLKIMLDIAFPYRFAVSEKDTGESNLLRTGVIIVGGFFLLVSAFLIEQTIYNLSRQTIVNINSGLDDNINTSFSRTADWLKIVDDDFRESIIQTNMFRGDEIFDSIIDGSTMTAPISAELFRQIFNYDDGQINNFRHHSKKHQSYINLIERLNKFSHKRDFNSVNLIFVTEPSEAEVWFCLTKMNYNNI